ncbi:MAG: ABC transporter permease [Lautropia sp.]
MPGPRKGDTDDAHAAGSLQTIISKIARDKVALYAAVVLVAVVLGVIFAPLITSYDPNAQNLSNRFAGYSWSHLLGTDEFGRDVYTRLVYGGRVTLLAAMEGVAISVAFGGPLGVLAGFYGGRLESISSRVSDALMSIPALIVALTVVAVVGNNLTTAMFAIGFAVSPRFFRIARGATKEVCSQTYIEASRAIGCSASRTIVHHVLPNMISPVIVEAALLFAFMILAEATLAFIGIGVSPPTASWGSALRVAGGEIYQSRFAIVAPGAVIILTVFSIGIITDALRDALAVGARAT